MPLTSSGQIKLSEIRNEFGLGSGQIAMSSLYGKGNAAASGQIRMAANFYGTAGSLVAGSITRGAEESKSNVFSIGRAASAPYSGNNIGSISYSTTETFGNTFVATLGGGLGNALTITPNNATAFTKIDKINIGGRTYTRRRSTSNTPDSTVGEMHFAQNYQSNYIKNPTSLSQARAGSPFTSSTMSFTAEEDRSFFCDTNFTSGQSSVVSSTDSKTNTSQRRQSRGFHISTNSNLRADSKTFGTQSSITITNPDYSAATTGIAGFFVKKVQTYNGTTFSGTPNTNYYLYCVLTVSQSTAIIAPHPNNDPDTTINASVNPWAGYNGLKRFEVTVGSTTQYYPFGAGRASLLGGTVSNMGFGGNGDSIYAMKDINNSVSNVGTSVWNHIGNGNTVNIKLY